MPKQGVNMQYQIETIVPVVEDLRSKLQLAYDRGAAGYFTLEQAGPTVIIRFDRELSDDYPFIQARIDAGVPYDQAAREQLAAELAEHNSPDVQEVVTALKATGTKVTGLHEWDFRNGA